MPAIGLQVAASGRLGLGPRRALERNVTSPWSGALGGETKSFAAALLWLITGLTIAYANLVAIPASVRDSFEADERHRTSVAIDTLTYELADRLPVKPIPHFGEGYERLRLLLVLDVVEPGETRSA